MLTEWMGKGELVMWLIIILMDVDLEDDQKIDGGIICRQILIGAN